RLDRRPADHGGRSEEPLLDPGGARLQGQAGAPAGHAGVRRRAPRDRPEGVTMAVPVAAEELPAEVMAAWGLAGCAAERERGGLINRTFLVGEPGGEPRAVVQRLHPIFAAEVNLDIEAVTEHLAARGLETPRLMRTTSGARWFEHGGGVWRALS